MTKKYVLAGAIAAFLAAANIAEAPVMNQSKSPPINISEIKKQNLVRLILPEKIREEIKQKEEDLNRAYKEINLIRNDRIYEYILNAYNGTNVPEHITKKFVRAQIWAESWDTPNARGKAGERGLMQIMSGAWNAVENELSYKKEAFNPKSNVYVGIKYLVWLDEQLKRRNDKWEELNEEEKRKLLAAAYNCGLGRVTKARYNLKKVPETTRGYIKNIERLMSEKYEDY